MEEGGTGRSESKRFKVEKVDFNFGAALKVSRAGGYARRWLFLGDPLVELSSVWR